MQLRFRTALMASSLLAAGAFLPEAFAVPPVPSSAAPEHLQQRFEEPSGEPRVEAPVVSTPAPQAALPANAKQHFVLRHIDIEGSTVYAPHTFDSLFESKIGQNITYGEAITITREITARYRADGYVLSQAVVTQAELAKAKSSGTLHVRIVEGFIHNVLVQNERPESDRRHLIAGYAQKITEEHPLNTSTLERYMLLINDLPGVTARAVIRPSPDTFGAADLVIEVKDKPFEASFTSDNRGNKFLGPWQEQATVTENSVAGLGERTTVRVINSIPFSDLHYVDIQHEEQLGSEGTRLIALLGFGRTNPGSTLEPLDFKGRSDDYALTVTHPFLRSRAQNFTGRFTFEARNVENDGLGVRLNEDRIRAFRLGGVFDTSDGLNGVDLANLLLSRGINGLGSTTDGAGRSRTVGEQEFTKLNFDLSRVQNLPKGFSILTAASGQYTKDALLTSEQYTLGGVGFGQAYDSGELSGDKALAGKVELRYGQPVNEKWLDSYQLYGYYDVGSVYLNDSAAGTNNKFSLASLGTGIRVNFTANLYGYLELGVPLTRNIASENNKDPRVFFSLTARY